MIRHILLADDSVSVHRSVAEILRNEPVVVTSVENGEEALRVILESTPDLVLADLTMPRMGGLEFCELMKREPEFRHIPVIFLVSPFDDFHESNVIRAGGAAHLVKPLDASRLISVVRKYLLASDEDVTSIEIEDAADSTLGRATPAEAWNSIAGSANADDDHADLPEPLSLSGGPLESEALPDGLVTLELSDVDRALDGDTIELSMQATEALLEDVPDIEHTVEMPIEREVAEVRSFFQTPDGTALLHRFIKDVIREEVKKLLPAIVERLVQERITELEHEAASRSVEENPDA